jgi:hypothetical protein
MIKRQEVIQGRQYDLIIKWRVDKEPTAAFPNAADPRWKQITKTDYYGGICCVSTPLSLPYDQWFVIRREAAQVIMSDFIDTLLRCIEIEELKRLISYRYNFAHLWNESKLAYHIYKSNMNVKTGLFPMAFE